MKIETHTPRLPSQVSDKRYEFHKLGDSFVVIAHQGVGEYYAFKATPTGYTEVVTAPGRQPFYSREEATRAAQEAYGQQLAFIHTNGEWPPNP